MNEKVKLAKLELAALIHFHATISSQHSVMKHCQTDDDLIVLGCSKYDHMLIPGGPALARGVTLSIIDSET
jgi:hypothetical protein